MSETINPRQFLSLIFNRIRPVMFWDICPEWNKKVWFRKHNKKLDWNDGMYCVLGEANGFSGKWQNWSLCRTCYSFGNCNVISWPLLGEPIRLVFMVHWNLKHRNEENEK